MLKNGGALNWYRVQNADGALGWQAKKPDGFVVVPYVGGADPFDSLGCGTVFQLAPDGTETILHIFNSSDGAAPRGGVILDAKGNLYGTTTYGGDHNSGTVYKLTPSGGLWTETVLHSFNEFDKSDGAIPQGSLLLRGGILYGTTQLGGANDQGTVFKLDPRIK